MKYIREAFVYFVLSLLLFSMFLGGWVMIEFIISGLKRVLGWS